MRSSFKTTDYRQKSRKSYLAIAKKKNLGKKNIRKAIRYQLECVKRNLASIDKLIDENGAVSSSLSNQLMKNLRVIHELHRQQHHLYKNNTHKISDREYYTASFSSEC